MSDMPIISGTTKLVGLLGSPVTQSMSPAMHTASFAKMGIDAVYLGFDVQPEQLESVVKGFAEAGVTGYNVTMPCKTKVLPYLDELTPVAELMGAVNTVVIKDGKSIGDNTDGAGFVRNMKLHGFEPEGKVITVAGAGGAGSAVFTQLALDGVVAINIFNRHDDFWDVTQKKIMELSSKTGVPMVLGDLDDKELLARAIKNSDLFVNATRVGMAPIEDECVIDEDMLHEGLFVADTVYEPRETKLIRMAKEHNLQTAPGLGMLLQQAALGEKIWFDVDMPTDYIEEEFF
ncbi:MAG TPA: shikimate dehydrogenase [Eggerthellaceae bacterium]|nr:shikimate dehydrogenase [Eggerthellaceae bacterium]